MFISFGDFRKLKTVKKKINCKQKGLMTRREDSHKSGFMFHFFKSKCWTSSIRTKFERQTALSKRN